MLQSGVEGFLERLEEAGLVERARYEALAA